VIFKIDPFFVQIFLGVMILLAVLVNRYREYKQEALRKIFNSE
jgi:ribose/xylose/arabinose/galactoside ABC-type transport system permease subunit